MAENRNGTDPGTLLPWLESLRLIVGRLGPQTPFQASLTDLLGMLSRLHGFLRPHLILFEPETGLLRLSLADTPPMNGEANYTPGVGVTGQVFATGRPVIVERMKGHPLFQNRIFQRTHEEMASLAFLSVPVLAPAPEHSGLGAAEVIGTLNADTPFVSSEDLKLRCLFLEVTASLIANEAAYMQEEMARQRRMLSAIGMEFGQGGGTGSTESPEAFVVQSKVMRHIMEQAAHLAQGRAPILLRGEPGTGKAMLARRIHALSPRRDMPLLTCHCGAVVPERQEADLRGYLKGTFPGAAYTHKGLFEQAHQGTLFLDAVDALSPEAQESLLTLLKESRSARLGASVPVIADVRIIASTGTDLDEAVREGRFSAELATRLTLCSLFIPPLRDRREDIIPLAEHLLRLVNDQQGESSFIKRISYPALELLTRYYWPGNVPELGHCMARAARNSEDGVIRAKDLPPSLQTAESSETQAELSLGDAVARFEKEMLVDALIKAGGNMLKAARDLKSSYRIVNYKVKKYGIEPHRFAWRNKPL